MHSNHALKSSPVAREKGSVDMGNVLSMLADYGSQYPPGSLPNSGLVVVQCAAVIVSYTVRV